MQRYPFVSVVKPKRPRKRKNYQQDTPTTSRTHRSKSIKKFRIYDIVTIESDLSGTDMGPYQIIALNAIIDSVRAKKMGDFEGPDIMVTTLDKLKVYEEPQEESHE